MSSIKTRRTKRTLTLAELGHDAGRDRPAHLFPAGYDDSVGQRARCGTLVQPPFRPRYGTPDEEMCVVCLAISAWLHDASDRDREEWFERHYYDSGDLREHERSPNSTNSSDGDDVAH